MWILSEFVYKTIMFANTGSFASSFLIQVPFIPLYCLMPYYTRTASTMLNVMVRTDILISFLLRRKHSVFPPLSLMLTVSISQMPFIRLRRSSYTSTLLWVYIKNGCWIFSNPFSLFIEITIWLFFVLFFKKIFYLFEREWAGMSGSGGQRKREKLAPRWAGSPIWGLIPGPWPELKANA